MATDAHAPTLEPIERDLTSASVETRRDAVARIGRTLRSLPGPVVVDRLAAALTRAASDPSWHVREATASEVEHLAALQHPHALPILSQLGGDARAPVRETAQRIMARSTGPGPTPSGARRPAFFEAASKATHAVNNLLDPLFLLCRDVERELLPHVPQKTAERFRAELATARLSGSLIQQVVTGIKRMGAEPTFVRANLAELVARAVHTARSGFPDAKVEVSVSVGSHLAPEVPQGDFELAVNNLVRNAFEALGARRGRVEVRAELQDDGHVELRVRDDGPGIAPEHRERLGEFGFSTKSGLNAGCGIAMVRKTVEVDCGGSFDVESAVGHGATMIVRVPVSRRRPVRSSE